MNPRIEKLCLPRHRRDAIWKFWQPNAKLEKIHPPVYWKILDNKKIHSKTRNKSNHLNDEYSNKNTCSNPCNYKTLVYEHTFDNKSDGQGCYIFVDLEHEALKHAPWKEYIEEYDLVRDKLKNKKDQWLTKESSSLNSKHRQHFFNNEYLQRQELVRYFKTHLEKDNLFKLDTSSYPNRSIPMSRRPRDALHIDFYSPTNSEELTKETTFKTFYHRKYLLPQHLHERTLKNFIQLAKNIELEIEFIGHFVLYPNELSKHEIKMFDLTSEFGDLYEGHIIQINKEKLVLFLVSTYHSNVKIGQSDDFKNTMDDLNNFDPSQSKLQQIVVDHVREYLKTNNNNESISQVQRMKIELQPLTNQEKRQVKIHLISEEEIIETLLLEITHEQEPQLFDSEYENKFYFLQGMNEQKMIHSVERKLKHLFDKWYSVALNDDNYHLCIQSTLETEYDTLNIIEKVFSAYANRKLTKYSREEFMRIAIENSFDDLLDELDTIELQPMNNKQIQIMMDDVQVRLRSQIERRLKAQTTAKILLMGPQVKKEIESIGKDVVVLDHHREIFINKSDTNINSIKMKYKQRNNGKILFHEEIEDGPTSYDRLPMSIDSLTILTRIQQRKDLALKENDNNIVVLGSGLHRLVTSKDHPQRITSSNECEQIQIEQNLLAPQLYKRFSIDKKDENSRKTLDTISIDTTSFNTSADTRQQRFLNQTNETKQERKKKRMSRSPTEYGKPRHKRKKHIEYESTCKHFVNSIHSKYSFLNNLFLLRQNEKRKYISRSDAVNRNAINEDGSDKTNKKITVNNLSMKSVEDFSVINEVSHCNSVKSLEEQQQQLEIDVLSQTDKLVHDSISIDSVHDHIDQFHVDNTQQQLLRQLSSTINENVEKKIPTIQKDLLNNKDFHIDSFENNKETSVHTIFKDDSHQKSSSLNKSHSTNESDEGFQDDDDDDDDSDDTEWYLKSLYGSLSTIMKQVKQMYQSKSSRLKSTLNLANIFITFLHIRKDTAYEIANIIIDARHNLVNFKSIEKPSSEDIYINEDNENDDTSISSDIITMEDSDTGVNDNAHISKIILRDSKNQKHNSSNHIRKKVCNTSKRNISDLLNSQRMMNRITNYLSEVDWRIFNYITKHFLQNGTMITKHALEFSAAFLLDLIEDSVYQTYFHSHWCSHSSINNKEDDFIENILIDEFFKKCIFFLCQRLQMINLPLMECIALMQTLKTYMSNNLLQQFSSTEINAVPIGLDPCIWSSTNILIKTICWLTDDILKHMKHDYLSDYTKLEYILVSYFHKIQIVHDLKEIIEQNPSHLRSNETSNNKHLLHIIDLNQAPKFYSHQAFKQFKFGEKNLFNNDIEALKDLVLLDIIKSNIKSMTRSYVPLNMNDLIMRQQNRILFPSPNILTQYQKRSETQQTPIGELHSQNELYRFDESTDTKVTGILSPEIRDLLDNLMKKYANIDDENLRGPSERDLYEDLSDDDLARLLENAIEAVQQFDRENNIGHRKLQNKKTVNDRLIEFFKYAGRHGVRLLDDILRSAKLRSNNPTKCIPLAVKMLKDRLKSLGARHARKQAVHFTYTLETLFMATNDEPTLIARMLRKKDTEKKSNIASEDSNKSIVITELNSPKQTTKKEINNIDGALVELETSSTIPTHSIQLLSTIDENPESNLLSSTRIEIHQNVNYERLLSNVMVEHAGLTVAQLIVLAIGQAQEPLTLFDTQITQICLQQSLPEKQIQVYLQDLSNTTRILETFKLTEEQLIQIAIEENISIANVKHLETSKDGRHLNENQLRILMNQIDLITTRSNLRVEQQKTSLNLYLDQFIELCHQQQIPMDQLLDNKSTLQKSSSIHVSQYKFTLTSQQISHLIKLYSFDIEKLIVMEKSFKHQQTQIFQLNSSQLAYLFAHHRSQADNNNNVVGLSNSQLIGIYALLQKSNEDDHSSLFSLDYHQIIQLALIQSMPLEHFHTLPYLKKSFQLTHNQLMHLAIENDSFIKQITSIPNNEKLKILDHVQLCSLISQHNKLNATHSSIYHTQSYHKYVHLSVQQILSLAKYSNITLDQLTKCSTEHHNMPIFRFKPEQLAYLWNVDISSIDFEYNLSSTKSLSPFILSDEQFSCLLGSLSISDMSTHAQSTVSLIQDKEALDITEQSIDTQKQLHFTLADHLTAMNERLKSSIQSQSETVDMVSNSILQRHLIQHTLDHVHQLSQDSIDDVYNQEIEMIPSFILDLLKTKPIVEHIYNSIQQGVITSDMLNKSDKLTMASDEIINLIETDNLNKTIIDGIQIHQPSLSQIHKIQTQLLTPKLLNEFQSGRLSLRLLDAYKSQSPLQIINKVHSSVTQLNKFLSPHSTSTDSRFDTVKLPVVQQTANQNTNIFNNVFKESDENTEQKIASDKYIDQSNQTIQQNPIIIYPDSSENRQQILQELRDRLDGQLLELKKEYGIEPVKGKTSIRQITSKLRTMTVVEELETLINREIDEVDILNIVEGHKSNFIDELQFDVNKMNLLIDRNNQHRLNRINERIRLVNILQYDIENRRLKRQLNLEELTALVFEDILTLEQLTNIHLTDIDCRIISMDRFSSIEQSMSRCLAESDYRQLLLQNNFSFDFIEQQLLKRSLTKEERIEQEELALGPYQDLLTDRSLISFEKLIENVDQQHVKLTLDQLKQILRRRAELVDQYEIMRSISSSIQLIEKQMNRSLTIDEKKRLTFDDYSLIELIQQTKFNKINDAIQENHPITISTHERFKNSQDRNLLEPTLTKYDMNDRDQIFNKKLSSDRIESNRDLADKSNTMKQIVAHQPSYLTDEQNDLNKKLSSRQSDENELKSLHSTEYDTLKDDDSNENLFIFYRLSKQPIKFSLSDIERATGQSLNSDELARFSSSRFSQIEFDLGRPLNDLQRFNLLNGDKLSIETFIGRQLSIAETGPHLVDITNIEIILNRSLTLDELSNLAGNRFDEICFILKRPLKREELIDLLNAHYENMMHTIDEQLNKLKEEELQELPINRIQHLEAILHRKLSPHELLRFAEQRFEPLLRLLSSSMKPEQILDLASGHYDKIETFFNRSLTSKEIYELKKCILEAHVKFPTMLDELEYIIQRRLNEQELQTLIGNQYHDIEIRLGKQLTEKQIRSILLGNHDPSFDEVEDLVHYFKRKQQDNLTRTRFVTNKLIEKLDQNYNEHHSTQPSTTKQVKTYGYSSSIQQKKSDIEFNQSTIELLKRLSNDVREHQIIEHQDSVSKASSLKQLFDGESITSYDKTTTPIVSSLNTDINSKVILSSHNIKPMKAFENISRIIQPIASKEYVDEMAIVVNAIDKFQQKSPKNVAKSTSNQVASTWLSNLNSDTTVSYLPAIQSIATKTAYRESSGASIVTDDDLYLGWKLFKSTDRPQLGLKEEKPRMVNVRHQAQTYVVGIPEEYADTKTKMIANRIYQGKSILSRSPKDRIIQEMTEFVSQLFHLPIMSDATHFIVPSRTYNTILEPVEIYQSNMIDIESDELQMRDSLQTIEWYEECIQRNVQVHAQIPTEYQPSIVHCHTGRQMIITPAKRAEQRKRSMNEQVEKSESKTTENTSTLNTDFIQRLSQPILDGQNIETTSTSETVTDLIMHTIATSQKTNLLEALEELFSQKNLDTYQINESDWQDLFLLLLNSYLRSTSINRKEIFKRLTDKIHDLRKTERRYSTDFYPSISVASSPATEVRNAFVESDINENKRTSFHFGLRPSFESINSTASPNDSENNDTIATTDKNSSMEKSTMDMDSLVHKKSQISLEELKSSSKENVRKRASTTKQQNLSMNSNAIPEHTRTITSMKHRQYKITVMYSDESVEKPVNQQKSFNKSTKLPPIVPKKKLSQTTQVMSNKDQLISSSPTINKKN